MLKLNKLLALVLAVISACCFICGCGGSNGDQTADNTEPAATAAPAATQDPNATADPNATEIPEWMWTPDPALFILGEDGYFEDQYLSAYWPKYLEYQYSMASNCAQYAGYPEGEGSRKLVFSYTPDEGGIFDEELGCYDFDSYQKFMTENMNTYFYLEEFNFITIDGHRALRVVFNYDPPGEPEHYTRVLQYSINVNGWIMGLAFSTQADTFPTECITCINTIHFKDGY